LRSFASGASPPDTVFAAGDVPPRAPLERRAPTSSSDKLRRGLWAAAWLILCRWTPRPLHSWRRLVLRAFGARLAPGAKVYPDARIWAPWRLDMAEGSTLGDGVECYNVDWVRLGPGATVSQRAFLCTATRDIDAADNPLMTAPIVLERLAWVGAEAYVGPGVVVHEGAVLAARGVAVRSLAEWTVVGGNPAKPLRARTPR
jgi:putative colanic acid biosynthesis acetyltransferase WcaF